MANILVCDDDKDIVEAIEIYLTQEGYHILKAYDGQEALDILNYEAVDLLIIDVMMPRLDGIRATVKIRESNPLPIIILSAKSEDTDKILGLNIGADDYITKPFNPLELIARVKSQMRRYTQLGSAAPAASEHIYITGGLTVNDDKKEVLVDGEPVRMTPIEYNILLLLMKNPGRVFSTTQIYESIWNEDALAADNTVAVHIRVFEDDLAAVSAENVAFQVKAIDDGYLSVPIHIAGETFQRIDDRSAFGALLHLFAVFDNPLFTRCVRLSGYFAAVEYLFTAAVAVCVAGVAIFRASGRLFVFDMRAAGMVFGIQFAVFLAAYLADSFILAGRRSATAILCFGSVAAFNRAAARVRTVTVRYIIAISIMFMQLKVHSNIHRRAFFACVVVIFKACLLIIKDNHTGFRIVCTDV